MPVCVWSFPFATWGIFKIIVQVFFSSYQIQGVKIYNLFIFFLRLGDALMTKLYRWLKYLNINFVLLIVLFFLSLHSQQQLQALMETLNLTEPHYIRCVKPNSLNRPQIFENASIIHQLRCGVSSLCIDPFDWSCQQWNIDCWHVN